MGYEKERKKGLRISMIEGAAASASGGFGGGYISPFAIAMNATASQIAALTSIPSLIAPISQLFTYKFMGRLGRKKIATRGVLIQALMWLPIMLLAFIFIFGGVGKLVFLAPLFLILFWTLNATTGHFLTPAWLSWMGDLIREGSRGRYFSRRNVICGAVALVASLLAASLLDYSRNLSILFWGFALLFFLAMVFRFVSFGFLRQQYEPRLKLARKYYFSFWQFVRKMRHNNFGRFTIYTATHSLAAHIAVPFFAVYMLRTLEFSYLTFTFVGVSGTITYLLVTPLWGKFSDRFGSIQTLRIVWLLISAAPILWLVSKNPYYIIFVPVVVGSLGWSGFNLAATNFIYDTTTRQRRSLCFAYYSILHGLAIFIGASLGGLIVKLPVTFMNIFLFTFLLSGIFRFLVSLVMLFRVGEVREVEAGRNLFRAKILPFIHRRASLFQLRRRY